MLMQKIRARLKGYRMALTRFVFSYHQFLPFSEKRKGQNSLYFAQKLQIQLHPPSFSTFKGFTWLTINCAVNVSLPNTR